MLALVLLITAVAGRIGNGRCPRGYDQEGTAGQTFTGQRIRSIGATSSSACAAACNKEEDCFTFTFDKDGKPPCALYQLGYVTGRRGASTTNGQLICAKEVCPYGTEQIGELGTKLSQTFGYGFIRSIRGTTVDSVEDCRTQCYRNSRCIAFVYDHDYVPGNGISRRDVVGPDTDNDNICALFGKDTSTKRPRPYRRDDTIACKMIRRTPQCPRGYDEEGMIGQSFNGQKLPATVYATRARIISQCKLACDREEDCFTFTFDPRPRSGPRCILYQLGNALDRREPTRANQIICDKEVCPTGTEQIGDIGTKLNVNGYRFITSVKGRTVDSIADCRNLCLRNRARGCVAFSYDHDYVRYNGRGTVDIRGRDHPYDNICALYGPDQTRGKTIPPPKYGRQDIISCGLTNNGRAESGLINVDTPTGGNNGETVATVSVYIIYIVGVLLLVNIICLTINCWKKCTRNDKRRYKVVSMRSDDESTDV